MHIIKISPMGFKIILSKDDLKRHGVDNILDHTDISGDFFAEIIEETNRLYGNPFTDGAIDAEFFEGKNGGGELFLCKAAKTLKNTIYTFTTDDFEALIMLCKRLDSMDFTYKSRLYHDGENFILALIDAKKNPLIETYLREHGSAEEINKLKFWIIDEHAKLISKENAVGELATHF